MSDGDDGGGGREYDTFTFVLAGMLAVIVLAAIGYGILSSSRVTAAIPSSPTNPAGPSSQLSTIGSR